MNTINPQIGDEVKILRNDSIEDIIDVGDIVVISCVVKENEPHPSTGEPCLFDNYFIEEIDSPNFSLLRTSFEFPIEQ